jgi:hypothetical protein
MPPALALDPIEVPLSLELAEAGCVESTPSIRRAIPGLVDAIIQATEGRGKRLA